MDRVVNYSGQVPLETDLLRTNQNTMVALSKLSAAMFGTAGMANGFATTQTVVPSMAVLVAPGEIYQLANLEAIAISSLVADTAHSIVKQGILLDALTINTAAPGTAGFSINYLIQASYQDSDTGNTVLPYYNAANPGVAFSGAGNNGVAQPTKRAGIVSVTAKAGVAATTGTQTTPAPDAGYLGLYVVTVANGASTVVNANISTYAGAPVLPMPLTNGRLIGVRTITSTQAYNPTAGATHALVEVQGAGGGASGSPGTGTGSTQGVGEGGAGAGGRSVTYVTVASIAGTTATIGAAGAGAGPGANGTTGGTTTFAGCTATGGAGATMSNTSVANNIVPGGSGGSASGGNVYNGAGQNGGFGIWVGGGLVSGAGGSTPYGAGGAGVGGGGGGLGSNGNAGSGYGSGGGGSSTATSGSASPGYTGGSGQPGVVIVYEYA